MLHQSGHQFYSHPDDQHPQRGVQQEVHQIPFPIKQSVEAPPDLHPCLGTHREQGSSLVSVERKMFAKWMKRAPMACLDVSKNLEGKQKLSFIFNMLQKSQ